VQPLHRDADNTIGKVIEPAHGRIAEPVDCASPRDFGIGVIGLDRIIDDQHTAAAAGERPADRSGQSRAPLCRLEFGFGGFFFGFNLVPGKTRL